MRGRKKGFKHSEETKAKMRGKRKVKEESEEKAIAEFSEDESQEKPIEVPLGVN